MSNALQLYVKCVIILLFSKRIIAADSMPWYATNVSCILIIKTELYYDKPTLHLCSLQITLINSWNRDNLFETLTCHSFPAQRNLTREINVAWVCTGRVGVRTVNVSIQAAWEDVEYTNWREKQVRLICRGSQFPNLQGKPVN